jgi:HEAT repeat protein
LSSPNPELQGPEKDPESSENSPPREFREAGADSDKSTPNNAVNATVQWSVSSEVELAIFALRDFLSGGSTAPTVLDSRDADIRPLVAAELLAAITGSDREAASCSQDHFPSRFEHQDNDELTRPEDDSCGRQRQERARQLFMDYGYLDEAINSLRASESAEERADAARTLGIVGSHRGTALLIAALFDDAPEVRKAAEEALSQIGDPLVSIGPISTMINSDIDYGGPYVVGPSEAEVTSVEETEIGLSGEVATADVHSDTVKSSFEQTTAKDPDTVAETSPAFEEPDQIRKDILELERLLVEAVAARKEADQEVLVRAEQESAFRAETAARRREDEENRKRAEEKAARRRSEDDRKMAAEQLGRLQAELEAQRLAEEEERLRVEAGSLRQTANEMARQRAEFEASEFHLATEARRLEAEKSLRRAEERYNAELKRLRSEEEALHRATAEATTQRIEIEVQRREAETQAWRLEGEKKQLAEAIAVREAEAQLLREAEAQARGEQEELHQQVEALLRLSEEVATRRAEMEAQKLNAVAEVEQLKEAQERMQAAEKIRREAEVERLQLEAEVSQQVEKEQRLLADIRRRAESEQHRLEEASRLRVEEQDRALAALEALRAEIEIEAQQRSEKERLLNIENETLRAAEREALTRIGQAESLRNRAEETHHLAAEKVQRIEAEARRRTMEDQRVLEKLEETRRNLDLEAHARAEQEKHLKEEIEALRRIEKVERNRIAEISSSRAEAEVRLQRERERLRLEEEALAKTESQIEFLLERPQEAVEWYDDPPKSLRPLSQSAIDDPTVALTKEFAASASEPTPVVADLKETSISPESLPMGLRSDDPHKRTAALASLARHDNTEAFGLIAGCFDDPSPQVRNAAARALRDREPDRTVESFTRAIEEGSPERARNIGVAIAASGLASEALHNLSSEGREDTYKALSLLFVMAKTGEIQPLVHAIEEHPEPEVCSAAIKLLNLSGQSDAAEAAVQRRRERAQ